jgi:hypothetical protein
MLNLSPFVKGELKGDFFKKTNLPYPSLGKRDFKLRKSLIYPPLLKAE